MRLEEVAKQLDMALEEALDRIVNKRELLIYLLKVFVDGDYMEKAREALNRKDYKTVEVQVHTLKGSGASLGLVKAAQTCSDVVTAIRQGRYEDVDRLFAVAEEEFMRTREIVKQLTE